MSEFNTHRLEISSVDQQIWAMLDVLGPVSRDPDPAGFGYVYDRGEAIAEPLGKVAEQLQVRHGLRNAEVFDRMIAASELSVRVRQCVEARLPQDHDYDAHKQVSNN